MEAIPGWNFVVAPHVKTRDGRPIRSERAQRAHRPRQHPLDRHDLYAGRRRLHRRRVEPGLRVHPHAAAVHLPQPRPHRLAVGPGLLALEPRPGDRQPRGASRLRSSRAAELAAADSSRPSATMLGRVDRSFESTGVAPPGRRRSLNSQGVRMRFRNAFIRSPGWASIAADARLIRPSDGLSSAPMTGDGCRAELFAEQYREPLKAACAEDGEIWQIYANNFGPDGFDDSIDRYVATPSTAPSCCSTASELAGMSCYLGIDPSAAGAGDRRHLLPPEVPRHRIQSPHQGHDAGPRLRLRNPAGRVPRRPPQRAQPGGDEKARRRARGRASRRPHHLD